MAEVWHNCLECGAEHWASVPAERDIAASIRAWHSRLTPPCQCTICYVELEDGSNMREMR